MGEAFGALGWDDKLGWWKGPAEFAPGRRIDLHVEADNDPAALRTAVSQARPAWNRLRSSEAGVRAAVAGQMTAAHNDLCAPEEVTEAQFANRLRLLSAKFEAAGTVELVYADGMLLGGHWIIVPVGADGVVGEALEAG